MKLMKIVRTFLALSSLAVTSYGQQVDFYREDVTLHLSDKYFIVNGDYYFRNHTNSKVKRLLFYPIDDMNGKSLVDSSAIIDITGNAAAKIKRNMSSGMYFEITIEANDTALYHIAYRQPVVSDSVRYILLTTKQWRKPLEEAAYTLVADNSIKIQSLTYRPDTVYQFEAMKVYHWRKENFLPEKDIIIHFTLH